MFPHHPSRRQPAGLPVIALALLAVTTAGCASRAAADSASPASARPLATSSPAGSAAAARPSTSASAGRPAAPSRTPGAAVNTTPAPGPSTPAPAFDGTAPGQESPQAAVGGCSTDPAVAPTAQGRAYLLAVQAAQPTWNLVTSSLNAEGGEVHHDDLVEQAVADRGFLASLRAITFTGSAAEPASYLESALDTYLSLLDQAAAQPGYFSAQQRLFAQLDEARAEASGQLRAVLGLPDSNCTVLRP